MMKPYHCKACRNVIAYVSACRIEAGKIVLERTRTIRFRCQWCGHEQALAKPAQPIDVTKSECYTSAS